MNSPIIQLLVLAGIAVFLILRLRGVLGTREGFEKPPVTTTTNRKLGRKDLEVIDGNPDPDITDHAPEGSPTAQTLAAMKRIDPSFHVGEFLQGARGAYEMILMAFERGDLESVKPFIAPDVYDAFAGVVAEREKQGLKVEASFVGISDLSIQSAELDRATNEGDVSVRFAGELTHVVRDKGGDIVEGSTTSVKRQKDVWTFSRTLGSDNPNWLLVATGE